MPAGMTPKVVFCTTENEVAQITRALAAGADEYIMKPFDKEIVRSKLQQSRTVGIVTILAAPMRARAKRVRHARAVFGTLAVLVIGASTGGPQALVDADRRPRAARRSYPDLRDAAHAERADVGDRRARGPTLHRRDPRRHGAM